MAMVQVVITLDGSADQIWPLGPLVRRILITPMRNSVHVVNLGTSAVTTDGSGTGVIKEFATPPAATVPMDAYEESVSGGHNEIETDGYWLKGTSTEKVLATYWTV